MRDKFKAISGGRLPTLCAIRMLKVGCRPPGGNCGLPHREPSGRLAPTHPPGGRVPTSGFRQAGASRCHPGASRDPEELASHAMPGSRLSPTHPPGGRVPTLCGRVPTFGFRQAGMTVHGHVHQNSPLFCKAFFTTLPRYKVTRKFKDEFP